MDDELNLDLDKIEQDAESRLKTKNRFEQLSEKVITTSKERDELAKLKEVLEGEKSNLTKERDFYKSFSSISSKYSEAVNYQDQILERVNKGYDPEEAAIAVLSKEGKLGNQPQPVVQDVPTPEGGSSPTILQGNKSISDMKADEKYDALSKLSNEEIVRALRG